MTSLRGGREKVYSPFLAHVSTFCARNGGNRKESEGFVLEVSIIKRLPGRPNFLRHC